MGRDETQQTPPTLAGSAVQRKRRGWLFNWIIPAVATVLLLAVVIAVLVSSGRVRPTSFDVVLDESAQSLSDGWTVEEGEQAGTVAEIPTALTVSPEGTLTISRPLELDAPDYYLITNTAGCALEVLWNGSTVFSYGMEEGVSPATVMTHRQILIPLEGVEGSGTLALRYQRLDEVDGTVRFNSPVMLGTQGGLLLSSVRAEGLPIALVMFTAGLGLILLLFFFIMLRSKQKGVSMLLHLALACMVSALWCLLDTDFILLMLGNSEFGLVLDYFAFYAIPLELTWFFWLTQREHRSWMWVWSVLFYVNLVGQALLYAFGVFSLSRMLPVAHLLIAGTAIYTLYWGFRHRGAGQGEWVAAQVIMTLFGVLALGAFWMGHTPLFQLLYQVGFLVFILRLLFNVCRQALMERRAGNRLRFYQELSRTDALTGMNNRTAYEEDVRALQEEMDEGRNDHGNLVLFFMDLNRLKKANDTYGHDAGDQLIRRAAACIRQTFGPWGSSYRIGGDEFTAIIDHPDANPAELALQLDRAVALDNARHGEIPLSIARGWGARRMDDGALRTLDQCRHRADMFMFRDKRAQDDHPIAPNRDYDGKDLFRVVACIKTAMELSRNLPSAERESLLERRIDELGDPALARMVMRHWEDYRLLFESNKDEE